MDQTPMIDMCIPETSPRPSAMIGLDVGMENCRPGVLRVLVGHPRVLPPIVAQNWRPGVFHTSFSRGFSVGKGASKGKGGKGIVIAVDCRL